MKVLVVGSLPPPERARSEALRSQVVSLLANGDTVEVVSPDPVATAHRYLVAGGVPGCLQVLKMASGFDSVLVQLQPGLPVRARAGRFERGLSLFVFSLALRRAHRVVIGLERLEDLPGGPGGRSALRVWRTAERIITRDEEEQARFLSEVGKQAEHLAVSSRPAEDALEDQLVWCDGEISSVEDVLELVRKRAALERRALSPSDSAHLAGWDRLAAPGMAMTESDTALLGPPEVARKPADLARKALAAADRRPSLWRVARVARLARRGAYAVLRPEPSDGSGRAEPTDRPAPTD
jgi:hypothetical protein